MNDTFTGTCRIKFGTGNVQIGTGINKDNEHRVVAFKYLENAFHPVPNDRSKTMEENGFCFFLDFSTVESIDAVINALRFIRDDMERAEREKGEGSK